MEAQLLLSFSTSTHLSLPVWDLIWWLQCPSSPLTHIHPVILISRRSHRAWPRPYQTAVLSICFSFPPSHFFPTPHLCHITSPPPSPIPHFLSYILSISISLVTVVSQVTLNFTTTTPVSLPLSLISLTSSLLFPSLFFSLSDNDIGKFAPVNLRMELPKSCRWMLHGALDWCMRCNTGDFGAWWTLWKMQGWAGFREVKSKKQLKFQTF